MITARQRDLLVWLARYIATHRCSPSFDEIADGMKIASKSQVHRMVTDLEEREMIETVRISAGRSEGRMKNRSLMLTAKAAQFIRGFNSGG